MTVSSNSSIAQRNFEHNEAVNDRIISDLQKRIKELEANERTDDQVEEDSAAKDEQIANLKLELDAVRSNYEEYRRRYLELDGNHDDAVIKLQGQIAAQAGLILELKQANAKLDRENTNIMLVWGPGSKEHTPTEQALQAARANIQGLTHQIAGLENTIRRQSQEAQEEAAKLEKALRDLHNARSEWSRLKNQKAARIAREKAIRAKLERSARHERLLIAGIEFHRSFMLSGLTGKVDNKADQELYKVLDQVAADQGQPQEGGEGSSSHAD